MKITQLPKEFIVAQPILAKLEAAGYEAYFVGGSVRDTLLGKPIHDVDIASSAFPEEIKSLFNHTVDTGIQHGTVMVLNQGTGYEITTFRVESTYTDFRRPDSVTFVRSLEEDLKRRDFTINALAMRYDGQVIDLFHGLDDLKNNVIRAVGNAEQRFTEDALRMMRALRFSAQLNFNIESDTRKALIELAPNLEKIAVERIRVEFEKLLLGAQAANSLKIALTSKVMNYLPGPAIRNWSLLMDDLEHDQASNYMVAWVHLLVRAGFDKNQLQQFMYDWKMSRDVMKAANAVVPLVNNLKNITVFDIYQAYDHHNTLLEVLRLTGRDLETIQRISHIIKMLPITKNAELNISGGQLIRDGVIKPGPLLGNLLKKIEYAVVIGELPNNYEALKKFAKEYLNGQG
ncbi:CCA-adding enzyme [Leuconostoc litchii]|uniref:CCA-adding enzyme n=1 Tax=Leuconostoc litchii TaxID=1981069 RepID=A0A6P2CNQ2_9LACO|nr:CCA tRNA nucleotidyltransferase [Leuconostoc litchii]TYC47184.1 CCA tRNA nucleotidyltransferase [Leuconostoc litchii]GMA69149.1 CCA-adding enzyme [Leuconostoc litchii]